MKVSNYGWKHSLQYLLMDFDARLRQAVVNFYNQYIPATCNMGRCNML